MTLLLVLVARLAISLEDRRAPMNVSAELERALITSECYRTLGGSGPGQHGGGPPAQVDISHALERLARRRVELSWGDCLSFKCCDERLYDRRFSRQGQRELAAGRERKVLPAFNSILSQRRPRCDRDSPGGGYLNR